MNTTEQKSSRAQCALNVGRWASYAVAGAATAIAAANDTEAAILYSGVINTPVGSPPAEVWLNTLISNSHQGAFKLGYFKYLGRGGTPGVPGHPGKPNSYGLAYGEMLKGNSYFHPAAAVGGKIHGYKTGGGSRFWSNLPNAHNISGGPFLGGTNSGKDNLLAGYFKGFGEYGQFHAAGIGYVAFEFNLGGGEQYGWAKVNMTTGSPLNKFNLVSYAYGTVGQSIVVGQTATPEPASLSLLALGAVGLLVNRAVRKRTPRPSID